MDIKKKERQKEKEYESISAVDDLDTKDSRFEEFVKTRRDRMKKESDLINTIKDTITK